jgi:hypothetical protein
MSKIIESHNPQKDYPSTDVASYLEFQCNYCLKWFHLVHPYSHVAEGAIQKEVLARDIETRKISKVGHVFPSRMQCCQEIMFRQRNKDFLIG